LGPCGPGLSGGTGCRGWPQGGAGVGPLPGFFFPSGQTPLEFVTVFFVCNKLLPNYSSSGWGGQVFLMFTLILGVDGFFFFRWELGQHSPGEPKGPPPLWPPCYSFAPGARFNLGLTPNAPILGCFQPTENFPFPPV